MKSYYYFVDAGEDKALAPCITVFDVGIGASKVDQAILHRILPKIQDNNRFYFACRSMEATDFVRKLFRHYRVSMVGWTVQDMARYLKNCLPCTRKKPKAMVVNG